MFQPRCFKFESIFSIVLRRSIHSFNIPSLLPPPPTAPATPRHLNLLKMSSFKLPHTGPKLCPNVARNCRIWWPFFFSFFFLHEVGSATVIFLKTFSSEPSALKRTKERFSSLANCYFVVLFTSIIVVLLDANDLSNNHHLSHDNDQSSLSHQRWFAAHIRPSNQYAGALTVDRCLLAVIVLGRR